MKNIKSKLTRWIGLLAVCLLPIGAHAGGQHHYNSGIIGEVDQPAGFLSSWIVVVSSERGKLIESVLTDEDGNFMVDLKPGRYVLTLALMAPGPKPVPPNVTLYPSTKVTVRAHRFTAIELPTSAIGKGYHQSGVIGQVVGPRQLVIPVDVLIMSSDGQYITDFLTAPDGSFEVYLKPGTYVMVADITYFFPAVPPFPYLIFGASVTVTVEKKQFETAVLPFPNGPIPAL